MFKSSVIGNYVGKRISKHSLIKQTLYGSSQHERNIDTKECDKTEVKQSIKN